jgi:Beta propeller domain
MRRLSGVLLTLILAGCSAPVSTSDIAPPMTAKRVVTVATEGLALFDSCDDVLSFFQANALEQVTAWGLGGWGFGEAMRLGFAVADQAGAVEEAATYSTTNVQEAGIDEPDLIKTNGEIVVALASSKLYVLDAEPRLRILGELGLNEVFPQSLFLFGDRVVVIGSAVMPMGRIAEDAMLWMPPDTTVAMIDLSDPTSPKLIEALTVEGNLLSARLEGNAMSLVVSSFPSHLPFVMPDPNVMDVTTAERRSLALNRQVIMDSTIQDWFPRFRHEFDGRRGRVVEGPLVDCDSIARPEEFSGLSSTTVVTVDLDEGLAVADSFGLASDATTVYASPSATYVATQQWQQVDPARFDEDLATTAIHRFDTSDPAALKFTGTGEVPGWLYSQWALSEDSEGRLRVASTTSPPWGFRPGITQSVVSILEPVEGALETVGAIGGLGIDEQIYAVRFMGDLAYIVTYRQVDPLYVIDLSDPTSPEVAGSLKIPGYSAYLHPVGDGLLVGVGQDADLNGQVKGTQVALFDVSDPSDPVQIDKITFPGGYSAAEWDHHAFLYWEPTSTLVIPLTWGSTGAVAIKTSPTGLEELATIDGFNQIVRTVVVGGDRLLTLSYDSITELALGTLEELNWIQLT